MVSRIHSFGALANEADAARQGFNVKKGHAKKLFGLREALARNTAGDVKRFQIRAYDSRSAFLRKKYLKTNSFGVLAHLADSSPALVTTRQTKEKFEAFAVTGFCGHKVITSYDRSYVFPLFEGFTGLPEESQRINLSPAVMERALQMSCNQSGHNASLAATNLFDYVLAVLNSPMYVTLFGDLLKRDWPRIPLQSSPELFRILAACGRRLRGYQTLERAILPESPVMAHLGDAVISVISHEADTVWLDPLKTTGFSQIPEQVWDFVVGGTKVCQQWLKDRKGRRLSADDAEHFCDITAAILGTIETTCEIDKAIEEHGGWPGAFA